MAPRMARILGRKSLFRLLAKDNPDNLATELLRPQKGGVSMLPAGRRLFGGSFWRVDIRAYWLVLLVDIWAGLWNCGTVSGNLLLPGILWQSKRWIADVHGGRVVWRRSMVHR